MTRALLVDDEAAILRLFKIILESENFQVDTASSAAEAKKRLGAHTYDVVVTDIRMETPTAGFEVVRAARALAPHPLIVMLTAFPVSPQEWKSAGADALHVKGTGINRLVELLHSRLKRPASPSFPVVAAQRP